MGRRQVLRIGLLTCSLCILVASSARAAEIEKGKSIYASRCAFCHGVSGKGDGPAGGALKPPPTNFATGDFWKTTKLESIKAVIANGKPGTAMVPFKASLSDQQIDDLLVYLKTLNPQP